MIEGNLFIDMGTKLLYNVPIHLKDRKEYYV